VTRAEAVAAMLAGRVHVASIPPPTTLQAKRAKLKELMDLSKLEVEYNVNGLVTTRRFTKSNEDTVRRFLRAYIEGAVRGSKDQAFAIKTMGKYFRTDDRDVLDETYEAVIKSVFNFPPYPAGIPALLREVEKQHAKAKTRRRKILSTRTLSASWIRVDLISAARRPLRILCWRQVRTPVP
jgi:ABC-type nitrate/sulfonate/bicarbonate transport system substrate-binding protein